MDESPFLALCAACQRGLAKAQKGHDPALWVGAPRLGNQLFHALLCPSFPLEVSLRPALPVDSQCYSFWGTAQRKLSHGWKAADNVGGGGGGQCLRMVCVLCLSSFWDLE